MIRLFFILIVPVFSVFAGSAAGGELPDGLFQVKLVGERMNSSYVGNPAQLFIDQWLPGEVILKDGQRRKVNALLYNGFHDELVYQSEETQYIKLEKERLIGFTLEYQRINETLYFEKIQPMPGTAKSAAVFAQVLHQGDLLLYAHRNIKSGGTELVREGSRAFERRMYKPNTIYLLQLPDGRWFSFSRLRRKTLMKLFPEKIDQIRSIQRSNRIRLRNNEQELIRLIGLLEPLF